MSRVIQIVGFETHLARADFLRTWNPVAQTYARMGARVELNAPFGRAGALPFAYIAKYEWPEDVFRTRFAGREPSDAGGDPVLVVQAGFFQTRDVAPVGSPKAIAFFDSVDAVKTLLDEWQSQKPKVRGAAIYAALSANARYPVVAEATSQLGAEDISGLFAPLLPRAAGLYEPANL